MAVRTVRDGCGPMCLGKEVVSPVRRFSIVLAWPSPAPSGIAVQ